MPEGCPCVADPPWTLFKCDREKMWHYSLWRRRWLCRYQSVPLTLSTHITSPYSTPLGTAFFTTRASFLWCEAKDEARWQLWHCVGHRRPTWTSLEDWKQQGTVTTGNSWVCWSRSGSQHALSASPHPDFPRWSTSLTQGWKPGMNQCVCSTEPGMKQQAHQHGTAQPWRTHMSTLGCSERGQHLQLSLAEPHQEDTVRRSRWMCKGERE